MKNIEKMLVLMCVVILILIGCGFKLWVDTLATIYTQQQARIMYLEKLEDGYHQACEDRDRNQAALDEIQRCIRAIQETLHG